MTKYVLRRLLYMIPILFGITLITFLLFNVVGGDPAAQAAGKHATVEQIEVLKRELGLDRSLPMQYVYYLNQIVTFDYGRSWSTKQKISTLIMDGIGASLSLTVPSFFITLFLSISISLLLMQYRKTVWDKTSIIICLGAISLSSLVYVLFLQYWLGYKLGWFPITGWDTSWIGRWQYLILPTIIFVVLGLGGEVLFYRTIFVEEFYQDYVRTARAKGLGTGKLLFKHVLRNALIPIITIVVIQLPTLILGALLLESFFGIPGLGGLTFQAISNSDFPVIKAITFISAFLYMIFQLLSDVLYAVVDPKIQLR